MVNPRIGDHSLFVNEDVQSMCGYTNWNRMVYFCHTHTHSPRNSSCPLFAGDLDISINSANVSRAENWIECEFARV